MAEDLPNEFDLIVIGTGFTESVIAAAASRIGKNVLHIDTNNYYGREWASFNFNDLSTFLNVNKLETKTTYTETEVQQFYNQLKNGLQTAKDNNYLELCNIGKINNIKQQWHSLADKIDDAEENDKENNLFTSEKSEQMEHKKLTVDCSVEDNRKQSIIEDKKALDITAESIGDVEPKEKEAFNQMREKTNPKLSRKELILKKSRDFNIDLYANVIYSRGPLVELLISSNIARYGEFRSIDHILTIFNEQNRTIPCTRSDVFNSNDITIFEKRILMKFLKSVQNLLTPVMDPNGVTAAADNQSDALHCNKTFLQYLRDDANFSEKLQHYFLYAICMANPNTKYRVGIEKTKTFLKNLGRYGNTPFLLPMFACGEMGQHFCRSCAVFGGIYCLNRNISKITYDESVPERTTTTTAEVSKEEIATVKTFRSIECNGQEIKAKHLVLSIPGDVDNLQEENLKNNIKTKCNNNTTDDDDDDDDDVKVCGRISRGIFITDRPIIDKTNTEVDSDSNLIFLRIPSSIHQQQQQHHENQLNNKGAFVIQLSNRIKSCPKELWLVHITCEQTNNNNNAEMDLLPYVQRLFHIDNDENSAIQELSYDNKPNILWSLYFNISSCFKCSNNTPDSNFEFIKNVHLTCGPYFELDYEKSIADAKAIFQNLYPNEEFLPRAPDPEEIIFFDDDIQGGAANETAAAVMKSTEDTINNNADDGQNINENNEAKDFNKENSINENLEI